MQTVKPHLMLGALALFAGLTALVAPAKAADSPLRASIQQFALADGEITRVDKDNQKLTIRHSPLVNLKMPGMTMSFLVKETTMLDQVKVGDKVTFRAEQTDSGALIVTVLMKALSPN